MRAPLSPRSALRSIAARIARNPRRLQQMIESKWLLWRNLRQLRPASLPAPLYVGVASRPARYAGLASTLKCLLMQSVAPRAVVLHVSDADAKLLPYEVLELRAYGLRVHPGGSGAGTPPTVGDQPPAFWATAEDDCYYPPNWLEQLARAWTPYAREAICHRAHRIQTSPDRLPLPSTAWQRDLRTESVHPRNVMALSGGVLYPPGCFGPDAADEELCERLCSGAPEIWRWWMLRRNGYWVRKVGGPFPTFRWPGGPPPHAPHRGWNGRVDAAVTRMIAHFGFPDQPVG